MSIRNDFPTFLPIPEVVEQMRATLRSVSKRDAIMKAPDRYELALNALSVIEMAAAAGIQQEGGLDMALANSFTILGVKCRFDAQLVSPFALYAKPGQ